MNLAKHTHCIFNMLSERLLLVGLFLLLNGVLQTAYAAPVDLFVSITGSGVACSQATPCALQTALTNSLDGDTVYIAEGSYTGTGDAVVALNKSITLYGGWDGTTTAPPVRNPKAHPTTIDGENARRGIYISGDITPVLEGLRITGGNAAGLGGYEYPPGSTYDAGGGVYVSMANVTLNNNIISDNTAPYGAGVFLNNSPGTLDHSTISGNTATVGGGGVFAYKGAPTLSNNAITSNNSSKIGGGVYLFSTTPSLLNNTITDNSAFTGGGGILVASCSPILTGNVIAGNIAKLGGGIRLWYSRSILTNNVIADNQASTSGGGLWIGGSTPTLQHTTIARNSGGDGTGIIVTDAGSTHSTVSLTNTILVGHMVGIGVDINSKATLAGTLWGSGYWANPTDSNGLGTVDTGTVNIWGDPDFIDPDIGNYHINTDSAAIDAGVDGGVTEDMDGNERPQNKGYDIGADEYVFEDSVFPWNLFLPAMIETGQL